jgi:TonB family protein
MSRPRNALVALSILLAVPSCFGQSPAQNASPDPPAATVTIPSYPDTTRGLEKLLGDMMKLSKQSNTQTLSAYVKSLELTNPDAWFKSVFGNALGTLYLETSEQSRLSIETSAPATLQFLLKDQMTSIEGHKFEGSCDKDATEKEYPLLLRREQPTPLYDARFRDGATESIWSYFAYVDGGFRYVGNLLPNPSVPPKKRDATAGSQGATSAPPERIRLSGNVQAARLVHQQAPRYPDEAKRDHIQGKVIIRAIIAKDGSVRDASVIEGVCVLAEPALTAVKTWRYQTTKLNGTPVEVDTTITVVFTLG